MSEPKTFASLSPTLLARKGGARPAMRPQIQPLNQFHEATARQMDDLGWNDMGEDEGETGGAATPLMAEVVPIAQAEAEQLADEDAQDETRFASLLPAEKPAVVEQREKLAMAVAPVVRKPAAKRSSARKDGRRAAFTLRLDSERHLKLRLASTIDNRSAQQIVTEALDQYLATIPEVASLAEKVRKSR